MGERSLGRVVITGASGFVGAAVALGLEAKGAEVIRLVRSPAVGSGQVRWDPMKGELAASALAGAEAVIHLAGESIGEGRWTAERKSRILTSRTVSTELVARKAAEADPPPRVLLCASAVGFYGSRGDEVLDEHSRRGTGYLADVCAAWEGAASPARDASIRTVHLRSGIVLGSHGGALAKMLPVFRAGVGGPLAGGAQWMSWITLRDVVRVFLHAIRTQSLHGPVNLVSPQPVKNADFTRALGRALKRPAILPVPRIALVAAFGEMAKETLLASQRALPKALAGSGFAFEDPTIDGAFRAVLDDAA